MGPELLFTDSKLTNQWVTFHIKFSSWIETPPPMLALVSEHVPLLLLVWEPGQWTAGHDSDEQMHTCWTTLHVQPVW